MDATLLALFRREVLTQARFVLFAEADLRAILETVRPGELSHSDTSPRIFYCVQGLLVSAANLSKALWGSGSKNERAKASARREPLRKSLDVEDSSPLAPTTMRNHFEHFDERLETWWKESPRRGVSDMNVMLAGNLPAPDPSSPKDNWRNLEAGSGTIIFWGDTFSIPAIVAEARRLYELMRPLTPQELVARLYPQ